MNRLSPGIAPRIATEEIGTVRNWLDGYKRYQIILAAVRMQLFQRLAELGGMTKDEVVSAFGIDGQYARFYLQALCDEGLLERRQELYIPTELATGLLDRNSPAQIVELFESISDPNGPWHRFGERIREERPAVTRLQTKAAYQQHLPGHMEIVERIAGWGDFPTARFMLEIGEPAGLHAIGVCRNSPIVAGTIACGPNQAEEAGASIARFNLDRRIEVRAGELPDTLSELGCGKFDIAIVAHALYRHRKALVPFLQAVARTMRPGGLLILDHYYCSPDCGEALSGLQDLDQALTIGFHPLCNADRFLTFVEMAGFTVLETTEAQGFCGRSKRIVAVKSGAAAPERQARGKCCE